jgi:hypothetical protein
MKKKKNNPVHNPSVSEVRDKRADLQEFLSKLASGEIDLSNKKETAKDRMDVVRKEIEVLRTEHNLPYKVICQVLSDAVGLVLSETTLRDYCTHIIGLEPARKQRKLSRAEAVFEAKTLIDEDEQVLDGNEDRVTQSPNDAYSDLLSRFC